VSGGQKIPKLNFWPGVGGQKFSLADWGEQNETYSTRQKKFWLGEGGGGRQILKNKISIFIFLWGQKIRFAPPSFWVGALPPRSGAPVLDYLNSRINLLQRTRFAYFCKQMRGCPFNDITRFLPLSMFSPSSQVVAKKLNPPQIWHHKSPPLKKCLFTRCIS